MKITKHMLSLWLCALILAGTLAGCADSTDQNTQAVPSRTTQETKESKETDSAEMEQLKEMAVCMEQQIPQITYAPMDARLLEFYTEPLKDKYVFYGRFSSLGYAYIIGICKEEKSSIGGLEKGLSSRDFSETPYNESYARLGRWTDDEHFETVCGFPGVRSLFMDDSGKNLYLGISQPENADIGSVFDCLVNGDKRDYLESLTQKKAQMLPPVEGAFLQINRLEHGKYYCEYVPVTDDEFEVFTSDETGAPQDQIEMRGIELYAWYEAWQDGEPRLENPTRSVLDYVKDHGLFTVHTIDEIRDITGIEYQPAGKPAKTITDADTIEKIIEILGSSTFTDMGKCPYTDLLVLTKKDGSRLELQLAADGCDGFILGSYACYTPQKADWKTLREYLETADEN